MKSPEELIFPDELLYSEDHEWLQQTGETALVGISDYAQDQLGDIVFVELPAVGETFTQGEVLGTLESVKAVSEVYSPISGEVIAVNFALLDAPEQVSAQPYTAWLVELRPSSPEELRKLLTATAYRQLVVE